MPVDKRLRGALVPFVVLVALVASTLQSTAGETVAPPSALTLQAQMAPGSTPQATATDAAAFAAIAEREISQLDAEVTQAQWKAAHQTEMPVGENSYECPSLDAPDSLPSGAHAIRRAYFFPPLAPAKAVMPKLTGQELLDRSCTLVSIRVELPVPNPDVGLAFALAVKAKLSQKFGNFKDDLGNEVHAGGAGWKEIARWQAGNVEIVSAYNPYGDRSGLSNVGAAFFVFAELPIVETLRDQLCCTVGDYNRRSDERNDFHKAVTISGLDASLRLRVNQVYETVYGAYSAAQPGEPVNKLWKEPLLSVLREWLEAQKTQPPAQRAAALFAADHLVLAVEEADSEEVDSRKKSRLRSELQLLGTNFAPQEEPHYTGNWLDQATKLDPKGEVGRMGTLAFIARGRCDQDDVIAKGEKLLAEGMDGSTELRVHFILGDAYSDVVALAEGVDLTFGDDYLAKYRGEEESARKKALDHYRAALSVDSTSQTARDAWLQAWHLSAGRLPLTRYVCGDI